MSRCLLARHRLEEFRDWIRENGWVVLDPTNPYEILRAYKPSTATSKRKTFVIYTTKDEASFHLTAPNGLAENMVRLFIKRTHE